MKSTKDAMLLYAVTDRKWVGKYSLYEQVELALKGGVTCVQLREKHLSYDEFLKEAIEIKALCNSYDVPFIINDNVDIAIACKADGVHVGQDDLSLVEVRKKVGPNMIIGVSTHTLEESLIAQKDGADYLGIGAVFPTDTKLDATSLSKDELLKICSNVNIPVVAIGGIHENNINELKNTGIDCVALVSAIFASNDIESSCKNLKELSKNAVAK